jgi:hypothetical protein
MNSIASLNWGVIGGVLLTGSFIVGGDGDPIATPVMLASAAGTTGASASLLPEGEAVVYLQPAPVLDRRVAAEAVTALRQAGITPERLAIAGGSINDLHAALTGAIAQASIDPEQLLAARNTRNAERAAQLRQYKAELSGVELPAPATSPTSGEGGMAAARSAPSVSGAAFAAANEPAAAVNSLLRGTLTARLARIAANAKWNLPDRFLLAERTDQEWAALRDAYAAVQIAQRAGRTPESAAQAIVDAAEGEPLTVAAAASVSNRADELRGVIWTVLGN